MKVCFIAHGGKQVGFGHLMRCMTLAEAFQKMGQEVFFISKMQEGREVLDRALIKNFYIPYINNLQVTARCNSSIEELRAEEKFIEEILCEEKPDYVIIDSYNVDESFFISIKRNTGKLIYIDDLYAFEYPVDCIINGTASACNMGYKVIEGRRLLLGMSYNLLRNEFQNIPPIKINTNVKDILVTTGGADPAHMTEKIICALLHSIKLGTVRIHGIIGGAFTGSETLDIIGSNEYVNLYKTPKQMSEIMLKCDFAICAGGGTLYELMSCGIPMLAFLYADNQRMQTEALDDLGTLINMGRYETLDENSIMDSIRKIWSFKTRKKMSDISIESIDGKGTFRCVQELLKL